MLAAKWFDMVIGVDIHIVMVPVPPAPPIPTPLPHPFVGLIFDPGGLVVGTAISAGISAVMGGGFTGPVLINNLPAANTGTEGTNKLVMPHFPMPPGIAWAPIPAAPKPPVPGKPPDPPVPTPIPSNDTILITGSKTVHIGGSNACRLGDLSMDCAEPIRLPTATVLALPMGPPVLVGGPPALDIIAALTSAIRTKWITGRLRLLTGAFEGSWRSRLICMVTGHPVDVASGMVITDRKDFEIPGPIPFRFERTYYSKASDRDGPLGHGWSHVYDESVSFEKGRIVHTAGDGRELYFRPVKVGETTRNESERLDLIRHELEVRILKDDLLTHVFAPVGRKDGSWPLVRIEDPRGNRIEFHYDEKGFLSRVRDSAGRRIEFVTDEAGRIQSVRVPHPADRDRQIDFVRYQYDPAGDLIAAYDAMGHPFRYAYKHHLLVQETAPNDLSFYFAYDGITPDARCVRTWGDGGIFDHVLTYDTANHITLKEDSYGSKTLYFANEAGLVEKIIDSLGRERAFEYDDSLRTVKEVDPAGGSLSMEYDGRGNLTQITDGDGVTRAYEFDDRGQPVREVFGGAFEFLHRYNEFGELMESVNPVGGGVTQQFNENGDLVSAETKGGRRFRFFWDQDRNLAQVELPGGASFNVNHDALGRPTHVGLPDGSTVRFELDLTGRPSATFFSEIGADRFEYDPAGLLLRSVSAGGNEVRYEYGNYNKITAIHDAQGTRRFEYDKEGSLVGVVNQKGERWEITLNSEGEPIRETDFAGRTTEYRLDKGGRPSEWISPGRKVLRWEWTPGGRVAAVNYEDGCFERYAYDNRGWLQEVENEVGTIARKYDGVGRLVTETWNDWTIQNEFDVDDLRTSTLTSDGLKLDYGYNAAEQITGLNVNGRWAQRWSYDRRGRPTRLEMPGGHVLETSYSGDGLITTKELRSGAGKQITRREVEFTKGGSVAAIGDTKRGLKSYAHGVHGLEAVYRNGEVDERFVYDEAGEWLPAGGPGRIGPGGRLELFGAVTYEYDDEGRVVCRTEGERSWHLEYNDRGQLVRSTGPNGAVTTFQYDPLGRRVRKSNGESDTSWTWDGETPLREERKAGETSEVRHWVFAPDEYEPLLVVQDGECLSVVTDHLGTPQEIVHEDGSLAWAGDLDAWGRLRRTLGDGFENPVRFPGQWHDPETGLHYNHHRYYDPATGRYLTPDPIGLLGGLKPYAYAPDPIDFADPTGLGCVRRFFSSFAIFFRSGIRPRHARAIMRQAMETGETYAFRNIADRRGPFGRFTARMGSMLAGMRGMRPKPETVHAREVGGRVWGRSNWRGIAQDGPGGSRFRSDYDPAYYRNPDGSMMNNDQAREANAGINRAIGGDELQHPTQMTYPEVSPEGARRIEPPGNCTEFRPDGTTRQVPSSETGPMWNDALGGSG